MTQHNTESPSARIADRPAEGKEKAERIIPPGYFYVWMYRKQLGRRNLSDEQKTYMMGKMYEARKNTAAFKGNQYAKGGERQNGADQPKGKTSIIIAKEQGVGQKTVMAAIDEAKNFQLMDFIS